MPLDRWWQLNNGILIERLNAEAASRYTPLHTLARPWNHPSIDWGTLDIPRPAQSEPLAFDAKQDLLVLLEDLG